MILDSNIIIDHLRLLARKRSFLDLIAEKIEPDDLAVSVITIQELFTGKSTQGLNEQDRILAIIAPLKVLAYTYEIAQGAGEIMRDIQTDVEFADAAIAATAIFHNAKLYTLNQKDFRVIKDLELY